MKCLICKGGETQAGLVTVTLEREGTTVVLKGVPADVCDNCGEYYLSETVTGAVLALVADAVRRRTEVEVPRYAA